MAWLGEELPRINRTAPVVLASLPEGRHGGGLFARRRDLFTTLDLVFMDTTSLYFEGAGARPSAAIGFQKTIGPT